MSVSQLLPGINFRAIFVFLKITTGINSSLFILDKPSNGDYLVSDHSLTGGCIEPYKGCATGSGGIGSDKTDR